ncbi:MAG: hypothetical protein V4850_09530 [Myxococcota bacterium]
MTRSLLDLDGHTALDALARRIPGVRTLRPLRESRPPRAEGVGDALSLGVLPSAVGRGVDVQGLLDALLDPNADAALDEEPPDALPPSGLYTAYGEANPVEWAGLGVAAGPGVHRSRADARWIRVADADCVGLLEGDIRVDVDEHGVEWLFFAPGGLAALRLRGGWVLVVEQGVATLCREEPKPVAVSEPVWANLDALATLDPRLVEEAVGTVDHVGLYVRHGVGGGDIVARVLSGAAPPHLDAVRAWIRTVPGVTWESVRGETDARVHALREQLLDALPEGVAWAAVQRDVLESERIVLALAGRAEGLDTVLDRVDDEAEAAGLGEVDLDPVPVRLQAEARTFARWWGRP